MTEKKQKKEFTKHDLTDVFLRGLYFGENLCRYKKDKKIYNDNTELYDYIKNTAEDKQSLRDLVSFPLNLFIMLYHEVYKKNKTNIKKVKENS